MRTTTATDAPPFHPAADLFPLLTGKEYAALRDDVAAHGQREDIVLLDGQILDGRNRYRVCRELGLEPRCRAWDGEGSPVAFVLSANLHRRHLDASQRAVPGPGAAFHRQPCSGPG
jgi:hypothetical protein